MGEPFAPGMITSNEPGIYREGMHGIRHESLVLCVDDGTSEFGSWLRFETITLCHIDTKPIIAEMLTESERKWINNYHLMVRATLVDLLTDEADKKWLIKATEEI